MAAIMKAVKPVYRGRGGSIQESVNFDTSCPWDTMCMKSTEKEVSAAVSYSAAQTNWHKPRLLQKGGRDDVGS